MKELLHWSSVFSTVSLLGFAYVIVFLVFNAVRPVDGEGYSLLAVLILAALSGALLLVDLLLRAFISSRRRLNLVELGAAMIVVCWFLW